MPSFYISQDAASLVEGMRHDCNVVKKSKLRIKGTLTRQLTEEEWVGWARLVRLILVRQ